MHVGTDTYGRVKDVGGTPVVTKFFMFNSLPIYPLQSFYLSHLGQPEGMGIPLVARAEVASIAGLPLARVDRFSVAMAYCRALCAVVILVGFIVCVGSIVSHLNRGPAGDRDMVRGSVWCLSLGIASGVLTYVVPTTTRRERNIRRYCGEILGINADPARVTSETALDIDEWVTRSEYDGGAGTRSALLCEIVATRTRIARGFDPDQMEATTDDLLARLDLLDRREGGTS